jgi:Protein tyrosine and serine/threonine kinase
MAPEVILHNRYNLKADVYSWAMVTWELLLLQKPYYKYSKDQHLLLVCEGGDRPPLESIAPKLWPTVSALQSLSASFSSIPSSLSDDEDNLDFDAFMTDPIRDLLTSAWDQDVEQRFTIKQVAKALDDILVSKTKSKVDYSTSKVSLKDILRLSLSPPTRGYSCLSSALAEYRDVRDIVAELSNDMPELPFLGCFNRNSENTSPVQPESLETKKTTESSPTLDHDRENEQPGGITSLPETKSFLLPVPHLETLLVQ